MADRRFFFCGQFGEGLAQFHTMEEWVVAEAIRTSCLIQDCALGFSAKGGQGLASSRGRYDTNEPRLALTLGDPI